MSFCQYTRRYVLSYLALRTTTAKKEDGSDEVKTSSGCIFTVTQPERFRKEKQRSHLARTLRNHDDQLHLLIKRNQLVDNELRNKIEHLHLLDTRAHAQKQDLTRVFNERKLRTYAYQSILKRSDELEGKTERLEKISHEEIKQILQKCEDNAQLRIETIDNRRYIAQLLSRNKRRIDECYLVNEQLHLYTQMNDKNEKQQRLNSSDLQHTCCRISNVEQANHQLENQLRISQNESLLIVRSHQDRLLKKHRMYQINQRIFHRPVVIRDSLSQAYIYKQLSRYPAFVQRLMNTIEQCVQWRGQLLQIDRLYWVRFRVFSRIDPRLRFLFSCPGKTSTDPPTTTISVTLARHDQTIETGVRDSATESISGGRPRAKANIESDS